MIRTPHQEKSEEIEFLSEKLTGLCRLMSLNFTTEILRHSDFILNASLSHQHDDQLKFKLKIHFHAEIAEARRNATEKEYLKNLGAKNIEKLIGKIP